MISEIVFQLKEFSKPFPRPESLAFKFALAIFFIKTLTDRVSRRTPEIDYEMLKEVGDGSQSD